MTKVSFERAKKWIEENGRPLEKTLIKFHFREGASQEDIDTLKTFQNPDGGFGNAMEPDLRTPKSSILGTSIALQVLRSLNLKELGSDIVESAIIFILNNYNVEKMSWRIIPPEAENSPHAPWWNQVDREDNFVGFHLNPTAEILGYLYNNKHLVPRKLIGILSLKVLTELKSSKEIEMHDFLCCKRLLESKNLDSSFHQNLILELDRLVDSCVVKDSSKWGGYGLRPLQVVSSPDSPFFGKLQKPVEENLDYEIDIQDASGAWSPTWSWGDSFLNEWEKAKNEWTGIITLEKLVLLNKFGRVEG